MRKRSHIAYFALAIVFATLAVRDVVTLGFEFHHWAGLLTIASASAATGLFVAAGIRVWREKKAAEKTL